MFDEFKTLRKRLIQCAWLAPNMMIIAYNCQQILIAVALTTQKLAQLQRIWFKHFFFKALKIVTTTQLANQRLLLSLDNHSKQQVCVCVCGRCVIQLEMVSLCWMEIILFS